MVGTRRLTELAAEAASKAQLPDGPLTVAVSGGADSAALLYIVAQVRPGVDAVHIHHGLSGSEAMEAAARAIANHVGVPFDTHDVEVPDGPSPEGQARKARYEVLTKIERATLTAHTADDNAETILMNLLRGSGVSGLTGIPPHRPPNIFRPVLEVRRSALRELSTLAGLPFVDDPMNSDLGLTRNRLRSRLMPVVNEFNPNVVEALTRSGQSLSDDRRFIDALARGTNPDEPLAAAILLTLPEPVANRKLIDWLRANGVEVSQGLLGRAWRVVRGDAPAEEMSGGTVLRRTGAVVQLERVG